VSQAVQSPTRLRANTNFPSDRDPRCSASVGRFGRFNERSSPYSCMESYEEAKAQAQKICARIEDGSMPCDEPCPEERLALFKRWMEEGMAP